MDKHQVFKSFTFTRRVVDFLDIMSCIGTFKLKLQSFKLYNNKYMIASAQIPNTESFAFIAI